MWRGHYACFSTNKSAVAMKKKQAQRQQRRKEIGSRKRALRAVGDYVKLVEQRETEAGKQRIPSGVAT
jgi:hypothetical protein